MDFYSRKRLKIAPNKTLAYARFRPKTDIRNILHIRQTYPHERDIFERAS